MKYFESRARELAIEHGKEQAEKLFKEYLYVGIDNNIENQKL